MKYLRRFSSHTDYEEWVSGDGKKLPNISYCDDIEDVHYNPYIDSVIIAEYLGMDGDVTILFRGGRSNISYMEVDGIRLDSIVTGYTFDDSDIHRVVYHLIDDTIVSDNMFIGTDLYGIILPSTIRNIGKNAFGGIHSICSSGISIPEGVIFTDDSCFAMIRPDGRLKIELPSTLERIGPGLFNASYDLDILLYAVTPPVGADENMFLNSYHIAIYVPDESVDIYRNTPNWNYVHPMSEYGN